MRRRCAIAGVLAAVLVTAAGVVVASAPAAQAQAQEPHESCLGRHVDDLTPVRSNHLYVNGGAVWTCDGGEEDLPSNCITIRWSNGLGDQGPTDRTFCPDNEDWQFVECRDDIRFDPRGPFVDDSRRWLAQDFEGHALVPPNTPDWWISEVEAESGLIDYDDDDDEPDLSPGQGCRLAQHPPRSMTCDQINERKREVRGRIGELRDYMGRYPNGPDNGGVTEERAEVQDLESELHGLESVGGVIPDDCWGEYPTDHYEITWDASGDDLTDPSRLMGWLATILFGLAKMAVSAMLWLVRLAFSFDVTGYRTTVGRFASDIDQQLVHFGEHPLSLFDMAWFALFAYAGFQAIRGRIGRAGGEIVMAIVMAGVGVVLIGNYFPQDEGESFRSSVGLSQSAYRSGGYFDSVGDLLNMSGVGMLRVALGEDANVTAEEAKDRQYIEDLLRGDVEDGRGVNRENSGVNGRLHQEFIERPFLFINYNQENFEDQEPKVSASELPDGYQAGPLTCHQVITNLMLVPNKSDTGPWPKNFLRRHGCSDQAEFNGKMTTERLMATVLATVVAVIVSVLVGLAAFTLLISKFLVAVFFVALPMAVVMAILPGRARQMAWGWATSLLQLWLAALGMGLVVALLMMGLDAIHATSADRQLMERWVMVLLLVSTIYMLRKRIVSGTQSVAKSVGEKLNSSTTGAGPSWAGAGAGGGGSGSATDVNLANADRGAARTGMATKAALVAGGYWAGRAGATGARWGGSGVRGGWRTGRQRIQENRQAKKAQRWHLTNTLYAQQLKKARGTLMGDEPTRGQALATVGRRHDAQITASTNPRINRHFHNAARAEERHKRAALGWSDSRMTLRRLNNGQDISRNAGYAQARRLGLSDDDIGKWNTTKSASDRDKMIARVNDTQQTLQSRADRSTQAGYGPTQNYRAQTGQLALDWENNFHARSNQIQSANRRMTFNQAQEAAWTEQSHLGQERGLIQRDANLRQNPLLQQQAREREHVRASHFTMEGAQSFVESAGE